ncbi:MAG: hypothetical protein RL557_254 [archaeon]
MGKRNRVSSLGSSEENNGKNLSLFRRTGTNLVELILGLYAKSVNHGIGELMANSWDADSERVTIECDPGKDYCHFIDDGCGMNEDDLRNFYTLGDSSKRSRERSPLKGRRFIGQFGLGSIVLPYLCGAYEMVTERDGKSITVSETFDGNRVDPHREITAQSSSTARQNHGTKIYMSRLRFHNDEKFSLKNLKKFLPWKFAILPDFKIQLNDEELNPRSVDSATTFQVDERGEYMGHVTGTIGLVSNKVPNVGMHIYVNEMSIGNPEMNLRRLTMKGSLLTRIIGQIHADGLSDAISVDKAGFLENDRGFGQLEECLRKELLQVARYIDQASPQQAVKKLEERKAYVADEVRRHLLNAGIPLFQNANTVSFASLASVATLGTFSEAEKRLVLNQNHPMLAMMPGLSPKEYGALGLSAAVHVLAQAYTKPGPDSFRGFHEMQNKLWGKIRSQGGGTSVGSDSIHPNILYSSVELSKLSSRSNTTIKDVCYYGLLGNEDHTHICGKDFLSFESQFNGLVSLYDIVEKRVTPVQVSSRLSHFHKAFQVLESVRAPFVYEYVPRRAHTSADAVPLYFIEGSSSDELYDLICAVDLRGKSAAGKLTADFNRFANRSYSLEELNRKMQNLEISVVTGAMRRAIESTSGASPHGPDMSNESLTISYRDFAFGYQLLRQNEHAILRAQTNSYQKRVPTD